MHDPLLNQRSTRRAFLARSGVGVGAAAALALCGDAIGSPASRALAASHHPRRARRVIHLCLAGGPSHLETFDWKPELARLDGKPFPASFTAGQQLAQLQNTPLVARGPQVGFSRRGQSGLEISDCFPHLGTVADDLCVIRSMRTEQINHDPAHAFMNSGSIIKGRPSMGSWLLYGLGAETSDLPGFVVMASASSAGGAQPISARQWSAGFLPSRYQGIALQARGDAVHYLSRPPGFDESAQRESVNTISKLNALANSTLHDPEIETRIAQYELAFRMQASVPELTDLATESPATLEEYGVTTPGDGSFASNCLLARRLAERGVRFIQIYHRAFDHHDNLKHNLPIAAADVDRPAAALIRDLKRRGMLDDTLILFGGEFGRTPMGQGSGRDHHILGFSMALAGGGVKGGVTYGATDELGYRAVENVVDVHDLHATMLHLCGIDHLRLTFPFQGRDFRLTDVAGNVVTPILA
jgi:Protein of unknown function (DUF1501)